MLDRIYIRERRAQLAEALRKRGEDPRVVEELAEMDERRRALIREVDRLRAERKALSREVAKLKREGKDPAQLIARSKELGQAVDRLEEELREVEDSLSRLWLSIPNIPHPSVPVGAGEEDNRVVRTWGEPRREGWIRPHWEVAEFLGVWGGDAASRMSGSRFVLLTGAGAKMIRALMNFFLDVNTREYGYTEVWPPALVRDEAALASGHLPKFGDEMYRVPDDGLWLIPTAELPLANLHRGETLREEALPLKYTAYTPCFRREAGSYGRDVRGLIRLHQFDKVELFRYTLPERSYDDLEEMVAEAEGLLRLLGLPYRVVLLCTGDLGFASAKTYDLEVWAPGIGRWLEVSSVSNTEEFQARRAGTRLRRRDGRTGWPHTLNGSGLAFPRVLAAILEHYQEPDGTVVVPEPLRDYLGASKLEPGP